MDQFHHAHLALHQITTANMRIKSLPNRRLVEKIEIGHIEWMYKYIFKGV